MRFFRSPELAFWAAAIVFLVALTVFAATAGDEAVDGGASTVPIAAPAPSSSQAREQVETLVALMPSGVASGTDSASLRGFAAAVDAQAREGAAIRAGEGAPETDVMLRGFQRVSADVARLTRLAADPVAATALRTQVGLDVAHLNRLVLNLPTPELPETGLDPFATPDTLDPLTPAAPARPTMPTLGAKP